MARLSDKNISSLVEKIGNQRDKFERALDSDFKRSVLRGPGGEIQVRGYLDDLADAVERIEDRFDGNYAASTEVQDLLERADIMNGYIRSNPSLEGANEWDVFGSSLQQLAAAYGTTFPLPDGAMVRRIGDGELETVAAAVNKLAKDLQRSVRSQTRGKDELKATGQDLEKELSTLADTGKTLSSRIRSGKPASAEARQLMDSVGKVESLIRVPGMPGELATAWETVEPSIEKIAQAYDL